MPIIAGWNIELTISMARSYERLTVWNMMLLMKLEVAHFLGGLKFDWSRLIYLNTLKRNSKNMLITSNFTNDNEWNTSLLVFFDVSSPNLLYIYVYIYIYLQHVRYGGPTAVWVHAALDPEDTRSLLRRCSKQGEDEWSILDQNGLMTCVFNGNSRILKLRYCTT